jgi:hypothetical protein
MLHALVFICPKGAGAPPNRTSSSMTPASASRGGLLRSSEGNNPLSAPIKLLLRGVRVVLVGVVVLAILAIARGPRLLKGPVQRAGLPFGGVVLCGDPPDEVEGSWAALADGDGLG